VRSEPIEVMLHEDDVYGAADIEAGDFAQGVERLEARVGIASLSHSARTPMIIDLCAGYTMLEDFESAEAYCDQAVESGWSAGLALNNRGALHVATGDYDSAIRDFQAAIDARGADRMARRNLQRIEARVAALRAPSDTAVAFVTLDVDAD
jgi:Flp pilus assembly protein TadD